MFKAFVLNAFLLALVAGMSIELRGYMDVHGQIKRISRFKKMLMTIGGTIIIGFSILILGRLLFGYGGGLLADTEKYPTFF